MDKLSLNEAAGKFDIINDQHRLFYNTETGKFDWYSDFADFGNGEDNDSEKFDEDCWIACPGRCEI